MFLPCCSQTHSFFSCPKTSLIKFPRLARSLSECPFRVEQYFFYLPFIATNSVFSNYLSANEPLYSFFLPFFTSPCLLVLRLYITCLVLFLQVADHCRKNIYTSYVLCKKYDYSPVRLVRQENFVPVWQISVNFNLSMLAGVWEARLTLTSLSYPMFSRRISFAPIFLCVS